MSAGTPAAGAGGHVFFSGDDRLEGILDVPGPGDSGVEQAKEPAGQAKDAAGRGDSAAGSAVAGGAVVAHPHPLYGGTMAQPVVYRVAKACQKRGIAALRFNFRGVGGSGGRYSGHEEYRDVEAALAYLRGRLVTTEAGAGGAGTAAAARPGPGGGGGRRPALAVAGYSFGSVMAAMAAGGTAVAVDALVLIALVVRWDELPADLYSRLERFRGPVLAVCGEADDLAPPWEVERALKGLGLDYRMSVIRGAGHLFEGRQHEVAEVVGDFLQTALRSARGPA